MLKLKNTDLLQNNKFRTSRQQLEHIATGRDKKDIFYINVKFWWKNNCHDWMFLWVGVFLEEDPLEVSCCNLMVVAGFSAGGSHSKMLYFHCINPTSRRMRNTKWNPKNNNSYGKIIFFQERGHM